MPSGLDLYSSEFLAIPPPGKIIAHLFDLPFLIVKVACSPLLQTALGFVVSFNSFAKLEFQVKNNKTNK